MQNEKENIDTQTHFQTPLQTFSHQSPAAPEKKENFFLETFKFIAIALLVVLPFRYFIAEPFIVSGASMDPTFQNGQYLIVDQISYRFVDPTRGDVVIFKYPKDTSKFFIKRVIGLPGETVSIKGSTVTIGQKNSTAKIILKEDYVKNQKTDDNILAELGPDEYFVMGDNRPQSLDSRIWGVLPKKLLVGRPLVRLWPIDEVGVFPGKDSEQNAKNVVE